MEYDKTDNVSKITLAFQDPIVETTSEFINYDLQSLISEVGGVLGLTLGLSGVSLTRMIAYLVTNISRNTRTIS